MNSITQELKYKQSIVKYALRNGVTAASIVYKRHRKIIYRWIDPVHENKNRLLFIFICR